MLLEKIGTFLKDKLELDLSSDKIIVTNAKEGKALFLGMKIVRPRLEKKKKSPFGYNKINSMKIRLEAPKRKILGKLFGERFIKKGMIVPRFT